MTARPAGAPARSAWRRPWQRRGCGRSDLGRLRAVRRGMAGVALVGIMVVSTSCATSRSELGTDDGPCFVALPGAFGAVHHQGTLLGVRRVPWSALGRLTVRLRADLDGHHPPASVCVVAFSGSFRRDRVERPSGAGAGPLAVVVLRYPSASLVATFIAHHRPLRFGHPYLIAGARSAPVAGVSGSAGPPAQPALPAPPAPAGVPRPPT